mgnify:CR=1 FL=1|jgi:hypothetical protein
MMSKKGQGISINTIIIAAIALLVLIVLAFLVANAGQEAHEGTSCTYAGGTCKDSCDTAYRIADGNCAAGTCCSPVPLR